MHQQQGWLLFCGSGCRRLAGATAQAMHRLTLVQPGFTTGVGQPQADQILGLLSRRFRSCFWSKGHDRSHLER